MFQKTTTGTNVNMTQFTFSYSSFRSEALRRLQLAKNAFSLAAKTSTLSATRRDKWTLVIRVFTTKVTAISFNETDKYYWNWLYML